MTTLHAGNILACQLPHRWHSTVGLLEARTCRATTKLLGLAATWVSHNEGSVIAHDNVLDLLLGGLVDVLLVICHNSLGNSLAHRIDLGGVAAAFDAQANVNLAPFVLAQ